MLRTIVMLSVGLVAPSGQTQPVPAIKNPIPPITGMARVSGTGAASTLEMTQPVTVMKQQTKTVMIAEPRTVDGQQRIVQVPTTVTVNVPVTEFRVTSLNLATPGVTVQTAEGKTLAADLVAQRLKVSTAVLLSSNGPVDPYFLQVVKPDTLIVVVPAASADKDARPVGDLPPVPNPMTAPDRETEAEKELRILLELTNAERKKAGVAELSMNLQLQKAAGEHTRNMARKGMLAHELDGKGPSERIRDQGYAFQALAENCAEGQKTPADVIRSWMNSMGHKENMLNGTYTEIGLGIAVSDSGVKYWTQVFAKPQK